MFIHPELHRQGRGSRLLAALDSRVSHTTGQYLITDCGTPAQAFYGKHGYAEAPGRVMLTRHGRLA
jgi:GNAT superfamily N-acetyltransferase